MLGQLSWKNEAYTACILACEVVLVWDDVRGLNLSRRDGGLLVVCSQLGGLGGNTLEDIIHEGVQNGHGTVGDTGVWVNLLEN